MSTLSRVLARKINLFLAPTSNHPARPGLRASSCLSNRGLFPPVPANAVAFLTSNKFAQSPLDSLLVQQAVG